MAVTGSPAPSLHKEPVTAGDGASGPFEPHFTVKQLSELWGGVSQKFIRKLFLKEPGVVVLYDHKPGKRVYRTLLIPATIARAVWERYRRPR
jgi:hypothetical protein